jgi:hypothetical protein
MKSKCKLRIAIAMGALAVLVGTAVYAQDKYSLVTPSGIAFSDFRGYEDWAVVSSARTDEVLKVIVANPTMIAAYKAGIPGNGQPFPDGSKIAKLQWKPKKSTEAPFVVDVPDVFTQTFVIEKDSNRFPNSGGWGYALFNYDAASDTFNADPSPSDCGHACHVAVKTKDHIFHPYQKQPPDYVVVARIVMTTKGALELAEAIKSTVAKHQAMTGRLHSSSGHA